MKKLLLILVTLFCLNLSVHCEAKDCTKNSDCDSTKGEQCLLVKGKKQCINPQSGSLKQQY